MKWEDVWWFRHRGGALAVSRSHWKCSCDFAEEATIDILAKNIMSTSLIEVKLDRGIFRSLGWHHRSSYVSLHCFPLFPLPGHPLGGILSFCETPQWFCGWGNVTRASIDNVAHSEGVKYQFRVNCTFKHCSPPQDSHTHQVWALEPTGSHELLLPDTAGSKKIWLVQIDRKVLQSNS